MDKNTVKNIFINRKLSILFIFVLLVLVFYLFGINQDYKYTILYKYQSVPDIELTNTLQEIQGELSGEVRGFVKFDKLEDQPKQLKQYYIIKPLKLEESQSQYFSIEEIIKMDYLAPRSMGTTILTEVNKSKNIITLEDEYGQQYFIDRNTKEVSIRDANGDTTVLIANDTDFADFIRELLGKK